MTPRQRQYLEAIKNYWKENKIAPTLEDLGRILKVKSVSAIHWEISLLIRLNLVTKVRNASRSIRLTENAKKMLKKT